MTGRRSRGGRIPPDLPTLLLLVLAHLLLPPSTPRGQEAQGEGVPGKRVLRIRLLARDGKVPQEGVLLVGRSYMASFPGLLREVPRPPIHTRPVPFRYGRARILLPRGLPVALTWKGRPWFGWRGPFFGGGAVTLREPRPSSLEVRIALPGGKGGRRRARLDLFTLPPAGTGAVLRFRAEGTAPGVLTLSGLPPGEARYVLLVEGRALLRGRLRLAPGRKETLSPAPPGGLVLEGRLQPLPGRPAGSLAGGRIFLDGWEVPWIRTDREGRFRLDMVPPDGKAHRIEVALSPRSARPLLWWPLPGRDPSLPCRILLPGPFRIRGRLLLPSGEPAGNRELALLGRRLTELGWTPWLRRTRTSPEGTWSAPVPPGKEGAVLLVPSDRGGPWGMVLTPPLQGEGGLDLGKVALPLGTRLFGRVRTREGPPLPGARVSLLPSPGSPAPADLLARETPAAPDGSYLFQGVVKGVYLLRARAPGRAGIERRLRVGAAPLEVDLLLPAGLQVRGKILLPDGRGAPGARISFEPLAEGWTPVVVLADSKGRFLASGVPPVPARIRVSWKGKGRTWSAGTIFPGKAEGPLVLRLFREP